jgi:tetratricopeptide (TPR) repeat protein
MAIKGSLREAGLADVCQLLAVGRKTGCLSVTDRSRFGQIFFDSGRVTFATIVNRRDRVGDMLVRAGKLTREQLREAVDAQAEQPDRRLGAILLEHGHIDRGTLDDVLTQQIQEAVFYLFTWDQGSFFFEADRKPELGELLISLNPERLLLEGARRMDEWSVIEQKIPSLDLVFTVDDDSAARLEEGLTATQSALLDRIDGDRTVEELADAAGLGVFETGQALYGLVQAGAVRQSGRKEEAAPDGPGIDEALNLGVAFFQTGMLDEAERSFRQVLEADSTNFEARHYSALAVLRRGDLDEAIQRLSDLLERAGGKIGVHLNLAYAFRKQGRFDRARQVLARARSLAPDDARLLLAEGAVELFAGHAPRATTALDAYRQRIGPDARPPATFFYCAGLAAAVRGQPDEAKRWVEDGIAAFPSSAPLQLLAGNLAEHHGDAAAAEEHYRQATEGDAGLAQAHRNLGDVVARRGDVREAIEHYQHAAEIDPDLGDGLYTRLADLYYRDGQRDEAVACWSRALELNPDNEVARNHLEVVARAES